MKPNLQNILQQMDAAIQQASRIHTGHNSSTPTEVISEINTSMHSLIQKYSPPGSAYITNVEDVIKKYQVSNDYNVKIILGILKSLRADYAAGNLLSIQELIHGDVFSDFLEMANHLEQEGYKDPAAVLTGGVLEEHLRKLCIKNSIAVNKDDGSPKKADTINSELAAANVISKLDQKNVIAWLGLRNNAAHGHYDKYTKEQVSLFVVSVRDFLTRNPA